MIEFIKQLFTFLAGLTQYFNNKTLIDAGKNEQQLKQTELVLDNVQKADDIRVSSGGRVDNFFLCDPDSKDE